MVSGPPSLNVFILESYLAPRFSRSFTWADLLIVDTTQKNLGHPQVALSLYCR